jgi:ATP-binding cassette subfamily B protein
VFGPGGRHGTQIEKARNVRGALRRLMRYLRPYRAALVVVAFLTVLGSLTALAGPWLMGIAIDKLVERESASALLRVVGLMLAAYLISAGAQTGGGLLIAVVAQKALRRMRSELFAHLQTLSLRFFDSRAAGDIMSRLTNDIEAISRLLSQNVTQLLSGVVTMFGILVAMFILTPWMALASMVVLPIMLGFVGLLGRKTRTAFRGYQKDLGTLNATLEETYSGQRVVIAYGQEARVLARFDEANESVRRVGTRAMTLSLLVMPMMGILANANVAVVAGLGGWLTVKGMASVGVIATFITYSQRFADPLRQIGGLYNQLQASLAGAERVFEILDTKPDLVDAPDAVPLKPAEGDIAFDRVDFSYVADVPVLREVSLRAEPGKTIALVGPTGAGKTTIVNLLTRFYDIDGGSIRVDGADIRGVTKDSLRHQMGIVLQQTFLFSETVKENIRYGRLDATDEEVFAAAELANADRFIRRLPEGYDTELSERGSNLSEGQRQLLAIARAMLARPRILVLDEATSSVDTRTEVNIQKALHELRRGRTSFVIAHRLSTIRNADLVLVIDDGRIIERGTHEDLLSARGLYHNLYMSQFRGARG